MRPLAIPSMMLFTSLVTLFQSSARSQEPKFPLVYIRGAIPNELLDEPSEFIGIYKKSKTVKGAFDLHMPLSGQSPPTGHFRGLKRGDILRFNQGEHYSGYYRFEDDLQRIKTPAHYPEIISRPGLIRECWLSGSARLGSFAYVDVSLEEVDGTPTVVVTPSYENPKTGKTEKSPKRPLAKGDVLTIGELKMQVEDIFLPKGKLQGWIVFKRLNYQPGL